VGAKAIRYYESIGLLPRPPRGANRYRRYGPTDVIRVTLLRRMRLLGIPLAAARPLLAGVSDARCAEVRDELLALVDKRLAALDREIAELCLLRAQVGRYQRALAGCRPEGDEAFSACRDVSCLALSDGASARLEEDDASCDELCECL
jgi:DNA-binding transcriptional MerR regulator